jgi:hypothetical protein
MSDKLPTKPAGGAENKDAVTQEKGKDKKDSLLLKEEELVS